MRFPYPDFSKCLPFSLVLALTSCGGGGGGGSDSANSAPPAAAAQPAALTQANASSLTSEALLQLEAAAFTSEIFLDGLSSFPFPVGISSSNCSFGGSEDLEFRDNDNSHALSSGDVLILRDRHCSSGSILSQGDITITYSFIGNGQAGTIARHTGTIAFGNYQSSYSQTGQNIFALNGTLSFDYEIPAVSNGTHALSISSLGAPLDISFATQQGSLQIARASLLERQALNDYEVKLNATYIDSSLNQSVSISTGTSAGLGGVYGQYPTSGVIKITGAHNSEVRLIPNPVVSTQYLAFSLDEQGQGIFTTLVLTPSPVWEDFSFGFFISAAN